jgi:hypothetical protein
MKGENVKVYARAPRQAVAQPKDVWDQMMVSVINQFWEQLAITELSVSERHRQTRMQIKQRSAAYGEAPTDCRDP